MRHGNRRGKLGRTSAHRNMMLRNMATSLFDKERIKTTLPKAKQLRPFAEKLITLARRQNLAARRKALEYILDKKVVNKLFGEIAGRFKDANGGYTRIVPFRARWGDGAELAYIELKDFKSPEADKPVKGAKAAKATKESKGKETKETKEAKAKKAEPKKLEKPKE